MADNATSTTPAIDDIWQDDLLGRKADAQLIVEFITKRVEEQVKLGKPSCSVLNLDAKWGQGKSFFLKRLAQQLDADGYLATYVNAWEDDHATDPLIAVISAIDKSFKKKFPAEHAKRNAWEIAKKSGAKLVVTAAKSGALTAMKRLLGDSGVDAIENVLGEEFAEGALDTSEKVSAFLDKQGEEFLKRFDESKDTIVKFRKALTDAAAVQNDGKPMFILIDELDRCRPTFSIELLERVKHLFNADRVVFIIATDTDQLRHSISAIYGAGFDGTRYLRRFFDRTIRFDEPEHLPFVQQLFENGIANRAMLSSPHDEHELVFVGCMEQFNLSLRDTEQCFDIFRNVITLWNHKTQVELVAMLPLIMLQHLDAKAFEQVVAGDASSFKLHACFETKNKICFKRDTSQIERLAPVDLGLELLREAGLHNLSEMTKHGPRSNSGCEYWRWRRIIEESAEHRHQWTENPPFSRIVKYPELVLKAARLAKKM